MPPIPRTPPNALLAISMFYLIGIAFLLLGYLRRSAGIAVFGSITLLGGIYYTVQYMRAKSSDSNADNPRRFNR